MSENNNIAPIFEIIKAPLYCAIQDKGRFGSRHFGVPWSGVMDSQSYIYLNQKLKNELSSPVIETMGAGLVIKAVNPCMLFWTGAECIVKIDDKPYHEISNPIQIHVGQTINVLKILKGAFLYFGIVGGFTSQQIMGSNSTFNGLGILRKHRIIFGLRSVDRFQKVSYSNFSKLIIDKHQLLQAYVGPEFDLLSEESKRTLFQTEFYVSNETNRMGFRLQGPPISLLHTSQMLSSAVLPGTVQLLPSNQMIVLMRECQTTGGYPRILQLDETSINQLAHRVYKDAIYFSKIEILDKKVI